MDKEARRQSLEDLQAYEKAVDGLDEMITVVDRDYRYLLANRAFLTYRGLDRGELIGHTVPEILDRDAWETTIKRKLDECFKGETVRYELRYFYPHLGERDLLISYVPIDGSNGVDRVACVLQDTTERKSTEAALRRLSDRLFTLENEERQRLARELHDGAAQDLTALAWSLSVVNDAAGVLDAKARYALAQSLALVNASISEIRTLSYLLHLPALDQLGLPSTLAQYVEGFVERSGIVVETTVSPALGRLPQSIETAIFRIVQECLTNIRRHSRSATARITLERGPAHLVLTVEDAGTGLRSDARLGVGIASMRERLQPFDGSLEITSEPGRTIVKAVIPLLSVKQVRH